MEKLETFVRSQWCGGGAQDTGSEVRLQSPVQCQVPGFSGRKGVLDQGSGVGPQADGWAGCQAPKNLTCDPGRPHRLKGLRDPEAGSTVCRGPPSPGVW